MSNRVVLLRAVRSKIIKYKKYPYSSIDKLKELDKDHHRAERFNRSTSKSIQLAALWRAAIAPTGQEL